MKVTVMFGESSGKSIEGSRDIYICIYYNAGNIVCMMKGLCTTGLLSDLDLK